MWCGGGLLLLGHPHLVRREDSFLAFLGQIQLAVGTELHEDPPFPNMAKYSSHVGTKHVMYDECAVEMIIYR